MMQEDNKDILLDFLSETLPYDEVRKINQSITDGKNYSEGLKELVEKAKSDKSIMAEIELRKDIKEAILEFDGSEYIRETINNIDKGKIILSPTLKRWMAAASILLLMSVGTGTYLVNKRNFLTNDQLYNNFYNPYNRTYVTRSSDSDILNIAREKYEQGKYSEAILIYESIPNSINIESEILFYKGLSNMELRDYTNAINSFERLLEEFPMSTWSNYGTWYLGLSFLKIGDKEKAVSCFTKVRDNKFLNSDKAFKILKKLN